MTITSIRKVIFSLVVATTAGLFGAPASVAASQDDDDVAAQAAEESYLATVKPKSDGTIPEDAQRAMTCFEAYPIISASVAKLRLMSGITGLTEILATLNASLLRSTGGLHNEQHVDTRYRNALTGVMDHAAMHFGPNPPDEVTYRAWYFGWCADGFVQESKSRNEAYAPSVPETKQAAEPPPATEPHPAELGFDRPIYTKAGAPFCLARDGLNKLLKQWQAGVTVRPIEYGCFAADDGILLSIQDTEGFPPDMQVKTAWTVSGGSHADRWTVARMLRN